jgi:predicted small secreted protein
MTKATRLNSTHVGAALAGLLLAGTALSLSACNTVAGAGKDVSSVGTATTNTASTVQQKL